MIIERYIHREILQRCLWIAGLLILVTTTNKFVDYLGDAASGEIPASYVLKLLWYRMLAMQTEVMPILLFLSVILAMARLNQDNELTVLTAAGFSRNKQYRIVLRFAVVFSLLVAVIAFFVTPWAKLKIDELKVRAQEEASISALSSGKFKELNKGDNVVYIEKLSDDKMSMQNVFLHIRERGKESVLKSDSAYFDTDKNTGNRFIIFNKGIRYQGMPGKLDYQTTEYEKYVALIEASKRKSSRNNPEFMPTSQLLFISNPKHQAELQWRISAVLICILLSILAVLLNQYPFGQKPFTLLLLGILIYFIYTNILGISETLIEREYLPAYIGLWWVHVAMVMVILVINNVITSQHKRNTEEIQILPAE